MTFELQQFVNVGCGRASRASIHPIFQQVNWQELRLDINPAVEPDIISSITDMSVLADACVHGVWSSHNLEHLHSFEVALALREFRRILVPGGFAIITVPDIQKLGAYLSQDKLDETLYMSGLGPITPLDIVFGHQRSIQSGNPFMAHKTAFTGRMLGQALLDAGFCEVKVIAGSNWDLWALAASSPISTEFMQIFSEGIA